MATTTESPGEVLRGFEIIKWNKWLGDWEVVGRFRPTELGARQAAADVKWLRERWPDARYEMRPLVSVPPPKPPEPKLTLDADEDPSPSEE